MLTDRLGWQQQCSPRLMLPTWPTSTVLSARILETVVSHIPSSITSTCLPWLLQLTKQQPSKNSGALLAHTLLLISNKSKSPLHFVMKVPAIRGKLALRPLSGSQFPQLKRMMILFCDNDSLFLPSFTLPKNKQTNLLRTTQ